MAKVTAAITTSVDGYVAGPHDGPFGSRHQAERLRALVISP
jgi:hypothetical protein